MDTCAILLRSVFPGQEVQTKNNLSQILKKTCLFENGDESLLIQNKNTSSSKSNQLNDYGGSYSIKCGEMEVQGKKIKSLIIRGTLTEMTLIENCLLCKNCGKAVLGNYNMLKSASYAKISFWDLLNLFNIKLEILFFESTNLSQ